MKKLFVVLLMAVAFCGSAEAQKGMMGVGVNANGFISFDGDEVAPGLGVKFQYNLSDYFRIEPSFTYSFTSGLNKVYTMTALANMHFFFSAPKAFRPYFILGGGFGLFRRNYKTYSFSYSDEEGLFVLNGGLGLDWRLSHNLSLQTEFGSIYGFGEESSFGLRANIGLSYNF